MNPTFGILLCTFSLGLFFMVWAPSFQLRKKTLWLEFWENWENIPRRMEMVIAPNYCPWFWKAMSAMGDIHTCRMTSHLPALGIIINKKCIIFVAVYHCIKWACACFCWYQFKTASKALFFFLLNEWLINFVIPIKDICKDSVGA